MTEKLYGYDAAMSLSFVMKTGKRSSPNSPRRKNLVKKEMKIYTVLYTFRRLCRSLNNRWWTGVQAISNNNASFHCSSKKTSFEVYNSIGALGLVDTPAETSMGLVDTACNNLPHPFRTTTAWGKLEIVSKIMTLHAKTFTVQVLNVRACLS